MATPPLCLGRTSQQWECVTEDADHSMATRKQRTRQEGVVDIMSPSVKKKERKKLLQSIYSVGPSEEFVGKSTM